jgi:hypothetical protein
LKKSIRFIQYIFLLFFFSFGYVLAEEGIKNDANAVKDNLKSALSLSIEELQSALTIKIHQKYDGASIIADDDENTFLGKISSSVSSESIFNYVGRFGSNVASKSIWNDVGRYGSNVARYSPFNEVTANPPFIVKNGKVIGRLTVNEALPGAVDPNWLKTYYK